MEQTRQEDDEGEACHGHVSVKDGSVDVHVPASSVTAPGRHAWYLYVPAGTSAIVNAPDSSARAKYGESSVITYAAMFGWMLQKIRLSPGRSNTTCRMAPTGYMPRSKRFPSRNEKTL